MPVRYMLECYQPYYLFQVFSIKHIQNAVSIRFLSSDIYVYFYTYVYFFIEDIFTGVNILVVGLGGGILPLLLEKYLPSSTVTISIIEQHPAMEEIASMFYFEKRDERRTKLKFCNCIDYFRYPYPSNEYLDSSTELISNLNENNNHHNNPITKKISKNKKRKERAKEKRAKDSLDIIFVDADSRDHSHISSSGYPSPLLQPAVLRRMRDRLSAGGILIFHLYVRANENFRKALKLFQYIFMTEDEYIDGIQEQGGSPARVYSLFPSEESDSLLLIAVRRGCRDECTVDKGRANEYIDNWMQVFRY